MTNNKMTKVQALTAIKALVEGNADLTAFVENELALLEKRKSATSKVAKAKAEENAKLAEAIIEIVGQATEGLPTMSIGVAVGISPQKATPILKSLVKEGKLKVETVKSKNLYSIAD